MIAAIVNPQSANRKTGKEWHQIQEILISELGGITSFFTEYHLHAMELTRLTLSSGYDTIISVGGDGTLNEVVNGFFQDGALINPDAALAVIPRGTGSDFVRSFDYPNHIVDIARLIKHKTPRYCDLVLARLQPVDNSPAERYFINIADLGIGGLTADMVNKTSKAMGGKVSFFIGALRATFTYKNKRMTVELDGKRISDHRKHYLVGVANGKYFGGGMHIAPNADLTDGNLQVISVGDMTFPEKLQLAQKIYRGEAENLPKVEIFCGKKLRVSTTEDVFVETDGELAGKADAEFEILPSAIKFIGI